MILYLQFNDRRLRSQFSLSGPLPHLETKDVYRAGSIVPAISWNAIGSTIMRPALFGFSMREGVFPMTSHRSESISAITPSRTFSEGRCIIPVDGFGLQRPSDRGHHLSYESVDDRMLAVAALFRPEDKGLAVTILTVPGADSHNGRLPAIIHEDDYDVWLDDTTSAKTALDLVQRPASNLIVHLRNPGSRQTS